MQAQTLRVPVDGAVILNAEIAIPVEAHGMVVFAHGSGSSRHSPRNQFVARVLQQSDFGTLLMDLLTEKEEALDLQTRELRFDIALLAKRLTAAVDWVSSQPPYKHLPIGLFGASTGAAAALVSAADASGSRQERRLARRPPGSRRRGARPREGAHVADRRRL